MRAKEAWSAREDKVPQEETWSNVGWKLHISLEDNGNNIERAWNLIVDLLMLYGIKKCKVLARDGKLPVFQWGKEVTIYYQNEGLYWQDLLNEITKRFIDERILPNYLPFSDRSVDGSEFFSFRNDSGFDKKYIDGLNAENFNPTDQAIPIEWCRLRITHVNQLIRPVHKNIALIRGFYISSLKDILWLSRVFIQFLGQFSKGLHSVGIDYPIWQLEEEDMLILCSDFPEVEKSQALKQFKRIKKLNGSFEQDLDDQSVAGIDEQRQKFSERVKTIEKIIERIYADIKASKSSPGTEKYVAFIGECNSGNISPTSGGGSSEGSPAKAISEDDVVKASDDNVPRSSGKSH